MTTNIYVEKTLSNQVCEECGAQAHRVHYQEYIGDTLMIDVPISKYCGECHLFEDDDFPKDALEFENPKMRDEYIDAHTPK